MTQLRWEWHPFNALTAHSLYQILALRSAVFVVEQTSIFQDADGIDLAAWHLLGWAGETLAAYLRVIPKPGEVWIGRVVIPREYRGQGVGRELMRRGIALAETHWAGRPQHLSAQSHLQAWYARFGFTQCGAGYLEDGIPHIPMSRG